MKFKRWYAVLLVAMAWAITTACDGLGDSSTGAGSELVINGDGNQVCIAEGTAADDNKNIVVDCDMMGAPDEPEEPGMS